MKILTDATPLTKAKSGIGRLQHEILLYAENSPSAINFDLASPHWLHRDYQKTSHRQYVRPTSVIHWQFWRFSEIARELNPDLIWIPSHRVPFGLPTSLPIVMQVHDLVWRRFPKTMPPRSLAVERMLFGYSVRRANAIICNSESTEEDLHHFYPEVEQKTHIVHPGACFPKKTRKGVIRKNFGLFVGTFEPRKNLYLLIEAIKMLPQGLFQNFEFVLAGKKGWGSLDVEAKIASLSLHHKVKVVYAPDDLELNQLYSTCSFLVMPSLHEGFGLPVIEAMAFGKPVIVSNVSSLPKIAGKAGLVFEVTDALDLAESLELLIQNEKLRSNMGQHALVQCQKFTIQKAYAKITRVFRSTCQSGQQPKNARS